MKMAIEFRSICFGPNLTFLEKNKYVYALKCIISSPRLIKGTGNKVSKYINKQVKKA